MDCIEVLDPDLHHGRRDTDLCFPKRSSREDWVRALRHASNEGKFRKGGWTQNTQAQLATCRWFSTPWAASPEVSLPSHWISTLSTENKTVPWTILPQLYPLAESELGGHRFHQPLSEILAQEHASDLMQRHFKAKKKKKQVLCNSITKDTEHKKLPALAVSSSLAPRILCFFKMKCQFSS